MKVSWHFRGPIRLKQFAFYTLGSDNNKRWESPGSHEHRKRHGHGHGHLHKTEGHGEDHGDKGRHEHRRDVGDWVTATINGQVVSWVNEYGGGAAATDAPGAGSGDDQRVDPGAAYSPPAPATSINAGPGNWGRQAYYNAEQGTAEGLVFLNNHGGDGSGVFDTTFGMSLSYASADNSRGSSSPVTLADVLIPDNNEFVIMTDKPCSDGSCGAVRDGTVAYHGFDGASKLFLLELSMPLSGKTGFNADMPAAWLLNSQIPRTMQYGSCSCWDTGCGEFDVFEVLDSGNQKCKSTWHGNKSKGDSNWFQRPISGTKKAAVVFDGQSSTATIVMLPDDFDFDGNVSQATIAASVNAISNSARRIRVALDS
jgi:hypothetical protein